MGSVSVLGTAMLTVALCLLGVLAGAARASATVTVTSHFIWTANLSSPTFVTPINNDATNGEGKAMLFVTPNDSAGGVCGCVTDSVPVGVVYNIFGGAQWSVYNEDESTTVANGTSFNVLVVQQPSANVFVHTATTKNTSGAVTYVNSTQTNGNPNAQLLITPNNDPNGANSVNNDHPVGAFYSTTKKKWAILNEDAAAMTVGAHFNVMVGSSMSNGGQEILVKAKSTNTAGDSVLVKNAQSTGNPNAVLFETPNWNPGGAGGTFDSAATGVLYYQSPTDRAAVFNGDGTSMPLGAAFNVLIYPS